jgi:hypothetical protein
MSELTSQYATQIRPSEPVRKEQIFAGQIDTYEEWDAMLEQLWRENRLTARQWRELRGAATRFLPAFFSVSQRLPKSTTYLSARGKGVIKCNNRAKTELIYDVRRLS